MVSRRVLRPAINARPAVRVGRVVRVVLEASTKVATARVEYVVARQVLGKGDEDEALAVCNRLAGRVVLRRDG